MPTKTWDTQADFQEGTFVDTEATAGGLLQLQAGKASGTWTSQIYEAVDWVAWATLLIEGVQPNGATIAVRFRSGSTSVECGAATYSIWFDAIDANGDINVGLWTYFTNPGAASTAGKFMQIQIQLVRA